MDGGGRASQQKKGLSKSHGDLPCCTDPYQALSKANQFVDDLLENGQNVTISDTPLLLPAWYCHDLITKGQKYFEDNKFNMFVCKLSGLLVLLSVPSILKILMMTDKSGNAPKAYKRYLKTTLHMVSWYESDLRNPNSKGRQSLQAVRRHHLAASKSFGPISQLDLTLTQFGFCGFAFAAREKLGLPSDQTGLLHFWRLIGHLVGIEDRFNLFRGCEMCTEATCRELAARVYGKTLDEPPDGFEEMSRALIAGMWPVIPFLNYDAYIEFTRQLLGKPPRQLTTLPSVLFRLQIFVHKMLKVDYASFFLLPYLNFQIWLALVAQKTMPVLAFIAFKDFWSY